MTDPDDDRAEQPASNRGPDDAPAPLLSRIVRSVFAPDVLEDGGKDAPLSPQGRIIFWSIVTVLVVGIVILLLVTASSR
jgi:hypothetical protein